MDWKMIFLFQGCFLRFHLNLPGCIQPKKRLWTCYITIGTAFQNLERLAFPVMRSWRGDPPPLRTKLLLRRQAATPCNRWPGNLFCQTNTCPKKKTSLKLSSQEKQWQKKRLRCFSCFFWLDVFESFERIPEGCSRWNPPPPPFAENGRCPILSSCFCCKNWTSNLMIFPVPSLTTLRGSFPKVSSRLIEMKGCHMTTFLEVFKKKNLL